MVRLTITMVSMTVQKIEQSYVSQVKRLYTLRRMDSTKRKNKIHAFIRYISKIWNENKISAIKDQLP